MNHLAHLRLAPPGPLARIGCLLGDFARGVDLAALPAEVQAGIAHHRAVDRFTDAHPSFHRSRARVRPSLRRFSGVVVDVFFDHFLARDWHRHGPGPGAALERFTADCYRDLEGHRDLLPPRLRGALPRMIANDWLAACRTTAGVRIVLERIAARLRRPAPLAEAVDDLLADTQGFAADFERFYPEVAAHAASVP